MDCASRTNIEFRMALLSPSTAALAPNPLQNHILAALQRTGGRVSGAHGAALLLDINPKTLDARMKKLGIRRTVGVVG